ncbi:MAG TPA: carboxylesterase family protein [Flavobacteriales bacterium]|nr:carboxylesterase family protein [Flavobacteriales bacterium]
MKAALLSLTALLIPSLLSAQDCVGGRYATFIFPFIDSIPAVQYGSNTAVGGGTQALRMDIYAPANDTLQKRPVVVMAFGGSFVTGSRADMAGLGGMLARMGYVAVAIDYRVGFFLPNSNTTMHAVQRCVHDMKGAIRFLRKTVAEDGNPYRIDPDRIIASGISAGGIGALHLTYMNEPSELPAPLVADSAQLGGMEGTSGPLGYSSHVSACVSFSGALMDTTWIHPGDPPFCGIHETGDNVVPCFTQQAYAFGFPTGIVVSGSHDISVRMDNIGVPHCYLEYIANDHVGYLNYDEDNALGFAAEFMAGVVCNETLTCGVATGVAEAGTAPQTLELFPVPARDIVTLGLPEAAEVMVLDVQGRTVLQQRLPAGQSNLDVGMLPNGIYTVRAQGRSTLVTRLVVAR